jgi:hypothetical protein
MLKIERINVLAIIGCIATWGAILYYTFRPEKYQTDIIFMEMDIHNRNSRLVYLLLNALHDKIGKTGVFLLLGLIGTVCIYYSFRITSRPSKNI